MCLLYPVLGENGVVEKCDSLNMKTGSESAFKSFSQVIKFNPFSSLYLFLFFLFQF